MQAPHAYKTPGQLIAALLDERGWTAQLLAMVLAVDKTVISKIINGKRAIDAEIALAISEVLPVTAEALLDLQKSYELAQARIVSQEDPGRTARARLFGSLPISEMIKRSWIVVEDPKDVSAIEAAVVKFFGSTSVSEIPLLPHAAKKTDCDDGPTPIQLAWVYRVKNIAAEMLVAKFSAESGESLVTKLTTLRQDPEDVRKVPRLLGDAGIRFVVVEALAGAKMDGVCFWLNDHSPVIGMSLRFDRIDNFWFVLRHEIEHVLRGHGKSKPMIDCELEGEKAGVGPDVTEEERVANAAAAEFCVPQKAMQQFVDRKAPFFAHRDVIGFARTIKVHPGLVAGQLQRRTKRYDRFRDHLVKVRSIVAPSAITDGWGDAVPLDQ